MSLRHSLYKIGSFVLKNFLPNKTVDIDWLSKSNIACLKEAIAEVSAMSFKHMLIQPFSTQKTAFRGKLSNYMG